MFKSPSYKISGRVFIGADVAVSVLLVTETQQGVLKGTNASTARTVFNKK